MNADQERELIRIGAGSGFAPYGDTADERFLVRRRLVAVVTPAVVLLAGGLRRARLTDAGRIRLSDILTRRISNLSPVTEADRGHSGTFGDKVASSSEQSEIGLKCPRVPGND